jgi:hypothetical protein
MVLMPGLLSATGDNPQMRSQVAALQEGLRERWIEGETDKWAKVIRAANIGAE